MQKSILQGLAFVAVFAWIGLSQGIPVNDNYAARVQLAVAKAWPKMDQIWPGADYSKLYLLLTNGSDYWAINSQGIEKLPYSEAPEGVRVNQSSFSDASYKGQPAMAIRLAQDYIGARVPYAFSLATHEAFHHYIQPSWSIHLTGGWSSRSIGYPINVTPLLYRRLVFEGMLQAATSAANLSSAKYWLNRWVQEFPKESQQIRDNDISEGTAEYAEIMADVYARMEPNSTVEQIRAEALEQIKWTQDQIYRFGKLDDASYPLGALAGWILDSVQPDWKSTFAKNPQTPTDLLLESVQEAKQVLPQNHWIVDLVAGVQKTYATALDSFIADWQNIDNVLVALPFETVGSFSPIGFFSSQKVGDDIIAGMNAELKWSNGKATLTRLTVLQEQVPPCGKSIYLVFPLSSSSFTLSDNKVKIDLQTIKSEFMGSLVEQNGRKYLCAQ